MTSCRIHLKMEVTQRKVVTVSDVVRLTDTESGHHDEEDDNRLLPLQNMHQKVLYDTDQDKQIALFDSKYMKVKVWVFIVDDLDDVRLEFYIYCFIIGYHVNPTV